jgi:hypothetical protein
MLEEELEEELQVDSGQADTQNFDFTFPLKALWWVFS